MGKAAAARVQRGFLQGRWGLGGLWLDYRGSGWETPPGWRLHGYLHSVALKVFELFPACLFQSAVRLKFKVLSLLF